MDDDEDFQTLKEDYRLIMDITPQKLPNWLAHRGQFLKMGWQMDFRKVSGW